MLPKVIFHKTPSSSMREKISSRSGAFNFFESLSPANNNSFSCKSVKKTAAAAIGPAKAPVPTSSVPRTAPRFLSSLSKSRASFKAISNTSSS